ncbi:MAG TPA: hypothetical protein DDY20_09755 [Desulfobulbaceae bacterium]|nr:hypothetical protein [Desulfobulbaceae bacterium]
MGEIKSTMDLVMERAARIGKATREELQQDDAKKKGVQLAVDFLEGRIDRLFDAIADHEPAGQMAMRQGAVEGLLRNIFLPRDEAQRARIDKGVRGIIDLSSSAGDVLSICREVQNIVAGYAKHVEQLRGQLEEQIRKQYEQLLAQQGGGQREKIKIDPTLQPKFREEWSRIEGELNSQYNKALQQFKAELGKRLGL